MVQLAASLAVLATPARAESQKWGSFQFSISWYRPDIDSEFAGRTTPGGLPAAPYAASFGNSNQIMFQGVFSKSLWITQVGTLDLGVGAGYWGVKGQGIQAADPTVKGDTTSMGIVPISLVATYRIDWFVESLKVPLAPYLRASLLDYVWWVNGVSGSTASAITTSGTLVKGFGALIVVAFGVWFFFGRESREANQLRMKSIAVLPFNPFGRSFDDTAFADGMHDDILTQLSKINGLRVIARTSMVLYRDSKKTPHQIGDNLDVGYLLEGSTRRSGGKIRITAQLIRTTDEGHAWSDTYDRNDADVFAVQSDIAQRIARCSAFQIARCSGSLRQLNSDGSAK